MAYSRPVPAAVKYRDHHPCRYWANFPLKFLLSASNVACPDVAGSAVCLFLWCLSDHIPAPDHRCLPPGIHSPLHQTRWPAHFPRVVPVPHLILRARKSSRIFISNIIPASSRWLTVRKLSLHVCPPMVCHVRLAPWEITKRSSGACSPSGIASKSQGAFLQIPHRTRHY